LQVKRIKVIIDTDNKAIIKSGQIEKGLRTIAKSAKAFSKIDLQF